VSYIKVNNKCQPIKRQTGGLLDRSYKSTEADSNFYELEPAIVIDIILDSHHPAFTQTIYDINDFPLRSDGTSHTTNDPDYSWIGKAKIRLFYSDQGKEVSKMVWATPLENNIKEYPLINEVVIVAKYFEKYYYTRKLNFKNTINSNADFLFEKRASLNNTSAGVGKGVSSQINVNPISTNSNGVLGKYFQFNNKIRPLQSYEGDSIIESRFGSSIRFGAYIDNPSIDSDFGNPSILIRNVQRPLVGNETIINTPLTEDVNKDGSSIQITSGKSISNWITTVGMSTSFTKLNSSDLTNNQIIINTDRLILSSRENEIFNFSKKRYAIVTDDEFTVDSNKGMTHYTNETFDLFAKKTITINSNEETIINSNQIYLGDTNKTQPAILGNNCIDILNELINWLKMHTHWYKHSHKNAGEAEPDVTQQPVELQQLIEIQSKLTSMLSDRVFIVDKNLLPQVYVQDR